MLEPRKWWIVMHLEMPPKCYRTGSAITSKIFPFSSVLISTV
jgi:hypothetical protein